ncbi:hypothetical protein Nepgr_013725 [Nepenthes gracilis]|uniref:Uncharacterized protein n=1 Tax=Nepenthes gracilis TaxID=150966 RepID=A0AAD3SJJ7_NEPGR|nr:hypothetical protein Nepgr_013725 [Nepenthes gracilis]
MPRSMSAWNSSSSALAASNEATTVTELATVQEYLPQKKTICSNYKKNKSAQRWNYHSFYSFHFHPRDVNPRGEQPQNHTLPGSSWRSLTVSFWLSHSFGFILSVMSTIHCGEFRWYIENSMLFHPKNLNWKLPSCPVQTEDPSS